VELLSANYSFVVFLSHFVDKPIALKYANTYNLKYDKPHRVLSLWPPGGLEFRIWNLDAGLFVFGGVGMERRAVFFIDGFNLYHSLDNNPYFRKYKWLNLWRFCEHLLFPNDKLVEVLYFTAYTDWNPDRQARHHTYVSINQHHGCNVIFGQFQERTRISRALCASPCLPPSGKKHCGREYLAHEEKMTDVNIAVNILKACVKKTCDAVYLLSGDNDLVPALETARELHSDIRIRVVLPINAKAKKLMTLCRDKGFKYMRIKEEHLAKSQFPDQVILEDKTYTKPINWN